MLVASYVDRLDLAKIFGRTAPLQVDLGCSDGSFLFQLAEQHPEKNFLGIERLARRVAKANRKASKIDNMRALRLETACAVEFLLPPGSVETFHLLFPDPWPKRRHHRRRIVTRTFLDSIHQALESNGKLRIATDHFDYFQQIERIAHTVSSSQFEIVDYDDSDLPTTKFERKFRAAEVPIYRLSLRKVSPVT